MRRYSYDDIVRTLDRILEVANPGPTFQVIADRVGRYIPWDFDYRYDEVANDGGE